MVHDVVAFVAIAKNDVTIDILGMRNGGDIQGN
jgi:hypothetical protein